MHYVCFINLVLLALMSSDLLLMKDGMGLLNSEHLSQTFNFGVPGYVSEQVLMCLEWRIKENFAFPL